MGGQVKNVSKLWIWIAPPPRGQIVRGPTWILYHLTDTGHCKYRRNAPQRPRWSTICKKYNSLHSIQQVHSILLTRKLNFQALLKKLMMVFCLSLDFSSCIKKFSNRIAILGTMQLNSKNRKYLFIIAGIGAGYIGNMIMLDAENQEGSRASKC